jgi:hypothetical protein
MTLLIARPAVVSVSPFKARWSGRTVVCIASGPSLTREDCDAVREFPVIVTNTTFRMAPWAEVLVGHDAKWWAVYSDEVRASFAGVGIVCGAVPKASPAMNAVPFLPGRGFGNSGTAAIALALHGGAQRVLLLGFDCKRDATGKAHWHEAHPASLGDAKSIAKWPAKFLLVAAFARKRQVEVINCSRASALTCFPRARLEDELHVAVAA